MSADEVGGGCHASKVIAEKLGGMCMEVSPVLQRHRHVVSLLLPILRNNDHHDPV
jgi:hypothetical protein